MHARTPTGGPGPPHCRWCMQDPSPQGPPNATAPYMEDHTLATTTPPTGTLQDDRRDPRRTKDEIQDDSDTRRLPTVYFLQYPTTIPHDSGENDDFHAPTRVHHPSLYL